MKTQLASIIRWLVNLFYAFVSNPLRVRVMVTAVAICLVLLALVVPALTTFAAAQAGGGH